LQLPSKQEILAEATKLFFQRNREVACYNRPEVNELQEAGLLVEARNKLMATGKSEVAPIQTHVIAHSSNQILNLKGSEQMAKTVEEWRKTDPYLLDIEGFLDSLKVKENELHVEATIDVNEASGYYIWLQIPYAEIPDSYKTTVEFKAKELRIERLSREIEETLAKLKFNGDVWVGRGHNEERPTYPKGLMIPGSTDVFKYHTLKMPEPSDTVVETDKDLAHYIHTRLRECGIFTSDETSTAETKYVYTGGKSEYEPNDSIGRIIYASAIQQPNKKEYADNLIEIDFEERLRPFKEGVWYYYGDEEHSGEQEIKQNAEIMWQVGKALSPLLPILSIHKDYDVRNIGIGLKTKKEVRLPPFSAGRTSLRRIMKEGFEYEHQIRLVEAIESTDSVYVELATLVEAMLKEGVPNTEDMFEEDYVFLLNEDEPMPIMGVYRATIPEVLAYLKEGKEEWNPENDSDIGQNGGIDIVHPYLRTPKTLVWKEDVEWSDEADAMKQLYFNTYSDETLKDIKNDQLQLICKAKDLKCAKLRGEMVQAILESSYSTQATTEVK